MHCLKILDLIDELLYYIICISLFAVGTDLWHIFRSQPKEIMKLYTFTVTNTNSFDHALINSVVIISHNLRINRVH